MEYAVNFPSGFLFAACLNAQAMATHDSSMSTADILMPSELMPSRHASGRRESQARDLAQAGHVATKMEAEFITDDDIFH